MPIYNPYNEVVQPAKYVAPMDLNLLLKGTQYKQEQSEKNFNEIQGQVNNLLSIPAYGKDKEILNQKLQELQQVMGGLDVTNLETPQAKQQINSLINQFSQDKDVQAIAQRGNSYQNMMAEKQDFDKKGKVYMNQGLRKLNKYYSGDDYIRDVKFSNDGYEAPNVVEAMKKIKELETPEEKQIPDGNGGYTIVKSYNPERLKKTTEQVLSGMPNWEKFNREQLAQKYEGIDIDKYAIEHYTPLQQLSQQNYDAALFGYSNSRPGSEDQKKYALAATKAKQDLDQATSILNNPYHGQAFLETEYQNMKEKAVNDIQNALNFNAEGENKMFRAIEQARGFQHDYAIKAQESANRIKEEQAKTLALGASSIGKPLDEVLRDPILMSQALAAGQQAKLAEYSQKENIKLENRIQFKDKLSTLGLKGLKDTDPVDFNMIDEQGKSQLRTLSYGDLKKELQNSKEEVVKSMVAGILKSKGEIIDPSEVTVTGIGLNRVIKINNSYFDGVPVSDVTISTIDQNNFKTPATGATGASGVVNTTKNKKMNIWGKDWTMTTVTHEGKKIQVVTPQTKEEYDNIPSGVKYYDTDGKLKIKE